MAAKMTHWERVRAALEGEDVDRVPVSMWRHFFSKETSAESLAEVMLSFQNRFDWDFMKVNPRASYHVEDWGVKTKYDGDTPPIVVETPVKTPGDWLKLKVLGRRKISFSRIGDYRHDPLANTQYFRNLQRGHKRRARRRAAKYAFFYRQ